MSENIGKDNNPSQELMKIVITETKERTFTVDFSTKRFDIRRVDSLLTAISLLLVEVACKSTREEHRAEFLSKLVERIGIESMIQNDNLDNKNGVVSYLSRYLQ